jgi:PEP-CTERM motif
MQRHFKPALVFTAFTLTCGLYSNQAFAQFAFTNNVSIDALVTTGATGNLSGNNYGGAGALAVAAPGSSLGEFQSVIQFNLSAATASFNQLYGAGDWGILSVSLQLTATPNNNITFFNTTAAGHFNVSLMQNNSWTEGSGTPASPGVSGITFNTLQSTFINNATDQPLGTFASTTATAGTANYGLTLGSSLISDIDTGGNLSLRLSAADSTEAYLFNSRSGGTHPELVIVVVPEPGTLALGAMGLAMFAIACRCRKLSR